ncbi:sulfite exporter TauE/SafE family protein [Desulfoluna butyratoxydans]|uniref:Probable membrane transporter protein n=1 Tax=Desulfoluna butyratoxydans TaxID=231438 RepID=A0A4U8YYX2_9BACT|nr:sulfite exporter TauE/SafE family protein [Desulfoluna butyratoxydans]VFQ46763.1 transmembrane protein taue-like [Desulfoluna butyratoxydans]
MLFETAGVHVAPWIPPVVAFGVSFITSMAGLSGAFLLLPFQMSVLGYVHPSVSATNQLFNIVAIPSGVWRFIKEGRMVWPLTLVVVVGTMPGVILGALIRVLYLPDPLHFKMFVGMVLLYIGFRMVRQLLDTRGKEPKTEEGSDFKTTVLFWNLREMAYTFRGRTHRFSVPGISFMSFVVGIIGGIYGIGGGAIIAPFFVSFYRLPVHTIAGATLMGTFVTSVTGVLFYQGMAPFFPAMHIAPDWGLGLLFGLGGIAGIYMGARCQKYMPERGLKWLLCIVLAGTAGKYIVEFILYVRP